jgi:predicted nucleic acid-binding protein
MTGWLVDSSVLLAREDVDDPHHDEARRLLEGVGPIATLDLAYYEVTNVAIRAWSDRAAAARLRGLVAALETDGGLVRADESLLAAAAEVASTHGLSGYDAAYVAAAAAVGARLVSCDVRDLVSVGLATSPASALAG